MVQETGKIGQCREFLPLLCVCFLFLSAYNCFIIISLSPSHDKFTSSFFHLSLSLSLSLSQFFHIHLSSKGLTLDFQRFWMFLLQPSTHTSIQHYTHDCDHHCWMTHLYYGFFFHHAHHVNDKPITNIRPNATERPIRNLKTSTLVGDLNLNSIKLALLGPPFYQLVVAIVIIGIVDMCSLGVLAICSLLAYLRKG